MPRKTFLGPPNQLLVLPPAAKLLGEQGSASNQAILSGAFTFLSHHTRPELITTHALEAAQGWLHLPHPPPLASLSSDDISRSSSRSWMRSSLAFFLLRFPFSSSSPSWSWSFSRAAA